MGYVEVMDVAYIWNMVVVRKVFEFAIGTSGGGSSAPLLRPGMEVEVNIGDSFLEGNSTGFYSLRHDFLPASVDTSTPAQLVFESDKIKLHYQDSSGAVTDGTMFHGGVDVNKDGLDCALIYDGDEWRLEMVSGVANNLRTMRSPGHTPLRDHFSQSTTARANEGTSGADEAPSGYLAGDIEDSNVVQTMEDHGGSIGEMVMNDPAPGTASNSREVAQAASPEDGLNSLIGSGVENMASWPMDEDEGDGSTQLQQGDGMAESVPVEDRDVMDRKEEQMGEGENAAHSDSTSLGSGADIEDAELEAALYSAMGENIDSASDAGNDRDSPSDGNNPISETMLAEMEAPSQTATPEMNLPSSQGKQSSSSSSSSSDAAAHERVPKVPEIETTSANHDITIDASNAMEMDFFADDDMGEGPLFSEPVEMGENGVASSSSTSSSTSSSSSSSSSEDEASGEVINEPEVDVF